MALLHPFELHGEIQGSGKILRRKGEEEGEEGGEEKQGGEEEESAKKVKFLSLHISAS